MNQLAVMMAGAVGITVVSIFLAAILSLAWDALRCIWGVTIAVRLYRQGWLLGETITHLKTDGLRMPR